ncbi:MAG: lysophospholipid acyltransferase family protein [Clostridia bacterium]|nr:lysophospholipid acyltransferase family protein [Clostridia bacterium]
MSFYSVAKFLFSPISRFMFQVTVEGSENLPAEGSAILCANHKSYIDPVFLAIVLHRPLNFMAKAELFRVPLLGPVIRGLGAFPVHRGKADSEAVRRAISVVQQGSVLAMFPEGTRLKQGETPQRFKSGAALIAFRTKAVIIPAAIITKGKVRLFKKTRVRIGKPMTCEDLGMTDGSIENLRQASEIIHSIVLGLLAGDEIKP